ncbi:MAG: ThuA domain-containing protein, partial [Planctomycetes bacterium]|nr:ThuA domain-containing protein [Planctomycetota bacterium]
MRRRMCILAAAWGMLWSAGAVVAQNLRSEDEAKIAAAVEAVPAEAVVKPAKPRKVLLYGHCNGFVHGGAIAAAKVAFPLLGKKNGAFDVVVSDDLANFEPDKLKEFDAVILSNTTGELFMPKGGGPDAEEAKKRGARLRESFMDFVKGGKGVMGIHAATDCSYGWKEYGEMMGGFFTGHPWNEKVGIKNDDPKSPINKAFGGEGFMIKDEIYQFNRGIYNRSKQRVLLSLDMEKTSKKGQREDQDFGISWIKTHGKGRVFYCALGHDQTIFMEPKVLQHYVAGLQYAIGDLEA